MTKLVIKLFLLALGTPGSVAPTGSSGWSEDVDLRMLDRDPRLPSPSVVDEQVQFTVYRPNRIAPGAWSPLLAFAHLAERRPGGEDPLERVRAMAERTLGDLASAYGVPRADGRAGVPPESLLTFVPRIAEVDVDPSWLAFRWLEDVHQQNFRIRAHPATAGRTLQGRLTVYLGAFILADVDLSLRVEQTGFVTPPSGPALLAVGRPRPSPALAAMETVTAQPYRHVFPSYSHQDEGVVRQAEAYGRALGDVYLRDRTTLRSGEEWATGLLELIDGADVFQLFWSHNSMWSDYVRREWEHALALRRPGFVRPTYWEEPMPQSEDPKLPPDDLARLHFHQLRSNLAR